MSGHTRESGTHSKEQSRDGSAALHVDHGQQTGEVSLSGSSKEQSVGNNKAQSNTVSQWSE